MGAESQNELGDEQQAISIRSEPSSKIAFYHDFLVGCARVLFYFIAVYLSILCGRAGSVNRHLLESDFLESLALSTLFFPFIFLYSIPFELATPAHFPHFRPKRLFLTGVYARLGWSGVLFLVLTLFGFWYCSSNHFLPFWAYIVILLLPFALSQFLFANKYRYLQNQRGDPGESHGAFLKLPFLIPIIIIFLAMLLSASAGTFASDRHQFPPIVAALAIVILTWVLSFVFGNRIRKDPDYAKPFLFESPFIREPIVLFCTLLMPYLTGCASFFLYINSNVDLPHIFSLKNVSIMIALFGLGLVFELMRYLGRYHDFNFARNIPGTDLIRRFKQSVKKYTTIFMVMLALWPLLYFFAGFNVTYGIGATLLVIGLIFSALYSIRRRSLIGSDISDQSKLIALRRPCKNLIAIKIAGYLFLLLSILAADSYLSVDVRSIYPITTGLIGDTELSFILFLVFATVWATSSVGILTVYVPKSYEKILDELGVFLMVFVQFAVFIAAGAVYLKYYHTSAEDFLAIVSISSYRYLAFKIRYMGDALNLAITYLLMSASFWIIIIGDRKTKSQHKSRR